MSFEGTKADQARCLLRNVRLGRQLGRSLDALPGPLSDIGQPLRLTKQQLRRYLQNRNIAEGDIGGSLDQPLSATNEGLAATYFVIHDTSTPNYRTDNFPSDIDETTWRYNDLSYWNQFEPVAHVFTDRTGGSLTTHRLCDRLAGNEARESTREDTESGALFTRREHPASPQHEGRAGRQRYDRAQPGLYTAQYRRLAVIYWAACVRANQMLVPAFHAVVDSGFEDGHDDPQNFRLQAWASALQSVLSEAQKEHSILREFTPAPADDQTAVAAHR